MVISCIMANYNTPKEYLDASISSILEQDYDDFELIIVDDASTDDSLKYLEEYQKKDHRIIVLKNDINLGLAASLNKAIAVSKGKYIIRMDTDDVSLPSRFRKQLNFMETHRDISVAGTFAKRIGDSNDLMVSPFFDSEFCKAQLLYAPCLIHPTVIMRKSFLNENMLTYDEKYKCSQDFDLWTRCIEFGDVCIQNEVLLLYRVHNSQISTAKRELQKNYAKEICLRQLKKLEISPTDDEIITHLLLCRLEKYSGDMLFEIINWRDRILVANNDRKLYGKKALRTMINDRISNIVLCSDVSILEKIYGILRINGIDIYKYIYSIIMRAYLKRTMRV